MPFDFARTWRWPEVGLACYLAGPMSPDEGRYE